MNNIDEDFYEGTNFRTLFIRTDTEITLGKSKALFGETIVNEFPVGKDRRVVFYANIRSNEQPPKKYKDKIEEVTPGIFEYRVYFMIVKFLAVSGVIVCSPLVNILKNLLLPKPIFYVAAKIDKICDNQFIKPADPNISIARLNIELNSEKDTSAKSLSIYGDDILSSIVYRDLLFTRIDPKSENYKEIISSITKSYPFTKPFDNVNQVRSTLPTSCRLKYDDAKSKPIGLNADRFGNYSFFLGEVNNFNNLINIFHYMETIDALNPNVKIDPLKRSKEALEEK